MEKDKNKFKLSDEKHNSIYKIIEDDVFNNKTNSNHPIAVVLGGQPGSGKSILIDKSYKEFEENNVVIINGDEYRRWHPNSKEILNENEEDYAFYTDADVRTWTSDLFDKAINEKYNIIFEGTMRTNKICDTLKRLKNEGFLVKVRALAVNGIDSLISTMERYEKQKEFEGHGRVTPTDSHKAAYYGMIDTLGDIENEKCFDTLEIFTRDGDIVYYNSIVENKIYSKYGLGIKDTLLKSREEQEPSIDEVKKRLDKISESRIERGEDKIDITDILKKIDNKCI